MTLGDLKKWAEEHGITDDYVIMVPGADDEPATAWLVSRTEDGKRHKDMTDYCSESIGKEIHISP